MEKARTTRLAMLPSRPGPDPLGSSPQFRSGESRRILPQIQCTMPLLSGDRSSTSTSKQILWQSKSHWMPRWLGQRRHSTSKHIEKQRKYQNAGGIGTERQRRCPPLQRQERMCIADRSPVGLDRRKGKCIAKPIRSTQI